MVAVPPIGVTISDDDLDSTAVQIAGFESFRVDRSSPRRMARVAVQIRGAVFARGRGSFLPSRSLPGGLRDALQPGSRSRTARDRRLRCTKSAVSWLLDTLSHSHRRWMSVQSQQ